MARGTIIPRELKDGTKKYDAVIRLNGRQVWKSFSRKKDAEEYLDTHSTEVRDGTYREIRKATFKQYSEHWKTTHAITPLMKPSTLSTWMYNFEKHILPAFQHMGMQSIGSAEVNEFAATLYKKGLSPKSIRNILTLLHWFFKKAKADNYVSHSPMLEGVSMPKFSKERKGRALRPAEIQALLASAGDRETWLLILIGVLTGMRRGEIFGLEWEHLDWPRNIISVRQSLYWKYGKHVRPAEGERFVLQSPKSETSKRHIDMGPTLKKELHAWYLASPKTGLVFRAADGRPRDPNEFVKRQFARAVAAAGLGKLRFHDLRHTFGALKIEQGENAKYIQQQMGHSSIKVTFDIYGELFEAQKPEAAAKTDALLFPVAEQEAAESTAVN